MSPLDGFSLSRWWSIVLKEFLQLRRDRLTFAMIVGIPIVQLALFGYAINTDPKHMPTAIIGADHSEMTRTMIATMKTSSRPVSTFSMRKAAPAAAARSVRSSRSPSLPLT